MGWRCPGAESNHRHADFQSAQDHYFSTPYLRRVASVFHSAEKPRLDLLYRLRILFGCPPEMPIEVVGYFDRRVPHDGLYFFRRPVLIDHKARRCVPQVMKSVARNLDLFSVLISCKINKTGCTKQRAPAV